MGNKPEISFGDSAIVINGAPKCVYDSMYDSFDRMKTATPGLTVDCVPNVEDAEDTVNISIGFGENTPDVYRDAVRRFVEMFAKEIDKVLKLPAVRPFRPPNETVSAVEKRIGKVPYKFEQRDGYPLVSFDVPRVLSGDKSTKDGLERIKLQTFYNKIKDTLFRYLLPYGVFIKISQILIEADIRFFRAYMNFDKDKVGQAAELLKKFETEWAGKIDPEYTFAFGTDPGDQEKLVLKMMKKTTLPS
jgi:hypothetical protein